ncbi:hypothetical protein BHU72_09435 [Desulfuribacillus stibiiarsenatis]|uniref:histidine kinase n=1 Tax=Desulfuribacillus stibiiarsenatis TaxID=1390249 RepID=A0A1E5L2R6_9FIRM|nr:ATP-binding protein [Desulfuribacillus stibiiarsenatis]OEH84430.1 hypothetical protein BHU72_09435 [Desulfuribacillus stibiiarsenatis]
MKRRYDSLSKYTAPMDLREKLIGLGEVSIQKSYYPELQKRIHELEQAHQEIQQLNTDLEARVNQRTMQLEMANKELEAFSYSVSHDLKAPLRTINGFSKALLEDYAESLNEEAQDYLLRIRKASLHMGNLIDSLLVLSRSARSDLSMVRVNLSQIICELIEKSKTENRHRKIQCEIEQNVIVRGDESLLRIAMTNLIENAIKYSPPENTYIQFGTTDDTSRKAYFIKDCGIGFNMQYYDRLFTPFQRLHNDTDIPGVGIGLATVRRIIARHGGEIWAESKIGDGSTFFFSTSECI